MLAKNCKVDDFSRSLESRSFELHVADHTPAINEVAVLQVDPITVKITCNRLHKRSTNICEHGTLFCLCISMKPTQI